jgi:hypothetical protein
LILGFASRVCAENGMPHGSAPIYTIVLPSGAQLAKSVKVWLLSCAPWWAASASVHAVAIYGAMWALGPRVVPQAIGQAPTFDTEIKDAPKFEDEPRLENYIVGETPTEPPDLSTETLRLVEPPKAAQEEQINTTAEEDFEESGGGLFATFAGRMGGIEGIQAKGPGPKTPSAGGTAIQAASGLNNERGSGGKGTGFRGRGKGVRKAMVGGYGGTKASERAVGAALNWFARHQNADGSWSLDRFALACHDGSCNSGTDLKCDIAATSFALLPFLGAGQTHKSRGPYRRNIAGGLAAIMNSQKSDGDLRGNGGTMYVHGLATLTLCEAYGMSRDPEVGTCAQRAILFIERAQDPVGGGWRYQPGEPGDTSVVGWQLMALKSGLMSGLTVNANAIAGANAFLKSASSGTANGLFSYQKGAEPTPTMTAVGALCSQVLGARRDDPSMIESINFLMRNLPEEKVRMAYYWYYASMAMHNLPGPEWDAWNRQMRRIIIDSQVRYGCASGSWSSAGHANCEKGGRVMVTSLCTLTLEVYYRYLPIYRLAGE